MSSALELPCPACGFVTFEGIYGTFEVCPVCFWQDDPLQLANPASDDGANEESLIGSQAIAQRRYPGEEITVRNRGTAIVYRKDPQWRRLNAEEIRTFREDLKEKRPLRPAVRHLEKCYWYEPSQIED